MAKKIIHKTIVIIEILHEEKVDMDNYTLSQIMYNIDEGGWSGVVRVKEGQSNIELKGKKAVDAVKNQGTDTEFFQMDDEGNELDDD